MNKLPDIRESQDFIQPFFDFVVLQPEDGAVHEYVLNAGELRIEPRPQFEQCRNPATHVEAAGSRWQSSAQDLEQGRFTSAIAAHQSDNFPWLDQQVNALQCPELPTELSPASP